MPNESKQIHVIGINTSNVESFFEAKKTPIFKAERITGPKRILDSFKTWLKAKNIPDSEMMRTFNCGIGFCLIAPSKNLKKIKNSFSKEFEPYKIGFISKSNGKTILKNNLKW